MEQINNIQLASQTFERIQRLFPNLTMTVDSNPEYVEISMDILRQPGLDFDIYLNLQNHDELHISTEDIWCEWFPISNEIIDEYINAVKGLITGEYRIMKFTKSRTVYKSLLQRLTQDEWITVFRYTNKFKFPWTKLTAQIIQNTNNSPRNKLPVDR